MQNLKYSTFATLYNSFLDRPLNHELFLSALIWLYLGLCHTDIIYEKLGEIPMNSKKSLKDLFYVVATCLVFYTPAAYPQAPFIDPADDEKHFGFSDNILFWSPEQQVAGYRNSEKISDTRRVNSGNKFLNLPYARVDLATVEIKSEDI